MDDPPPYTGDDFKRDVQRQMVASAVAALSDARLQWAQVAPFLDAARALCRDDLRLNGRLALHGLEQGETGLEEAEEAYLSLSVAGREDGLEWLSQTWWLSDVALADEDPERVRATLAAMERSLAKVRRWLEEQDAAAPEPSPPGVEAPEG